MRYNDNLLNCDILSAVKLALGVTVEEYDNDIKDLILSALYDLNTNGVSALSKQNDPLILQAVKTYCRANFHSPADYDRLLAAYESQKGHLMNCDYYTDYWKDEGTWCEPTE